MATPHRAALAALATAALGLCARASAVTPSHPDAVAYAGTFHTSCSLPSPQPASGPYSCTHSARAVGCAGVADSGTAAGLAKVCRADLVRGRTRGSASLAASGYSLWTCDNGAGTGTFVYQPSPTEPAFRVPVNLVVLGGEVVVSGSYVQPRTRRTVVVRAHFPAVCSWETSVGGYTGVVNPA